MGSTHWVPRISVHIYLGHYIIRWTKMKLELWTLNICVSFGSGFILKIQKFSKAGIKNCVCHTETCVYNTFYCVTYTGLKLPEDLSLLQSFLQEGLDPESIFSHPSSAHCGKIDGDSYIFGQNMRFFILLAEKRNYRVSCNIVSTFIFLISWPPNYLEVPF